MVGVVVVVVVVVVVGRIEDLQDKKYDVAKPHECL